MATAAPCGLRASIVSIPERFEQTIGAPISSGPLWPGGRLHTLNRAGGLEVIDGITINPKLKLMREIVARRFEPQTAVEASEVGAPL